jgi:hypothetical protein
MSKKQRRTLEKIFSDPVPSNIVWKDIESLFTALGAEVDRSAEGSRVRVFFNGVPAVFHSPHPQKDTAKGAVRSVRRLLIKAGIKNDEI